MRLYRKVQPWLIWFLGASFFFCEYFARVNPSAMLDKLMMTFNVGAYAMGSLGAYFYYPYIIMQIPVGLLIDRHGPRVWLCLAAVVSALGAVFFAMAKALWMAKCGRFLIGFGASFAFVGTLKLATIWFDYTKLGLLAGLTQGTGMLGAAFGEAAFVHLVHAMSWQGAMALVAGVLFFIAMLIALIVRERSSGTATNRVESVGNNISEAVFQPLMSVLRTPASWTNALYAGFLYAPTAALGEFWGVTFFHNAYRMTEGMAGFAMSAIFLGWAMGGPLAGWLSDRYKMRRPFMILSVMLSFLLLLIVIRVPGLSNGVILSLMFCYGLCNSGVALSYAVAGEIHTLKKTGISIAFTNMVSILVGGALLQPLLGYILDVSWQGKVVHGLRIYSYNAYEHALLILPLCLIIAFVCILFTKESYKEGELI